MFSIGNRLPTRRFHLLFAIARFIVECTGTASRSLQPVQPAIGELVVPAVVTGTFSNPKFAPDVQQIAQMKVRGLVPNFDNPASVTGALQICSAEQRTLHKPRRHQEMSSPYNKSTGLWVGFASRARAGLLGRLARHRERWSLSSHRLKHS